MKFDIQKQTTPKKNFRVDSVMGMFDIKNITISEKFEGELPIEKEKWNIGIIVGPSGTGKTTIIQNLFPEHVKEKENWSENCILDDMPKECSIKEITKTFNNVGFSSPPSWLKPFNVLSEGEKMRVRLAKELLEKKEIIVFDEFTSVVDRQVAKFGSYCVGKNIRKNNKKFVAVSCHYDIIDWLEPDWIFDTKDFSFFLQKNKDQKLNWKFLNAKNTFGKFLGNITI